MAFQLVSPKLPEFASDEELSVYIQQLEESIEACNEAYYTGDTPLVEDPVYDMYKELLEKLAPDSPLLAQVNSLDDESVVPDAELDKYLYSHPMMSICTIKSMSDKPLAVFKDLLPKDNSTVDFFASMKMNGHGIRIAGNDGEILRSTSRGRSTNGKEITGVVKQIVGDCIDGLVGQGAFEIRCEILLPFSNLAKARQFNSNIKNAFTGVSSMIRASATPEEWSLLHLVAYDIMIDGVEFETLEEKFTLLKELGFEVPINVKGTLARNTFEADIQEILDYMADEASNYDYYTDGVVVSFNDCAFFAQCGAEKSYYLGNVALKMGKWEQNAYTGMVVRYDWRRKKSKIVPVAIIEPVTTSTGQTVTRVPMYAPCYILLAEAYPGNPLSFRYGGEAGVVPCMPDGRLLTDKSFKSLIKRFNCLTDTGMAQGIVSDYDEDEEDVEYFFED